jgi:hypothetical protein
MRKRVMVPLSCCVVLLLGCLTLWLTWPVDRITRQQFVNIQLGMTEAEVVNVLGRPTGDAPKNVIIMFESVPESFMDPDSFPLNSRRQWVGTDHAILVELDEHGQVSSKHFGHVNAPESMFARICRRLGL